MYIDIPSYYTNKYNFTMFLNKSLYRQTANETTTLLCFTKKYMQSTISLLRRQLLSELINFYQLLN